MIEGKLREKYIANMKKHYEYSLRYINNYRIFKNNKSKKISSYKGVEEYKNKKTKSLRKLDEVPEWYPELLKLYLTEVSKVYICGHYECVIDLEHNDKKTIEEIQNEVIFKNNFNTQKEYNTYKIGIGKEYKNLEQIERDKFKKYKSIDLTHEQHKEFISARLTFDEIEEIRREVELTKSTLIMVATQGCTFDTLYCPIRDRVIDIDWNLTTDYGLIKEFLYFDEHFNNSNKTLAQFLHAED